MIISKKNIKDVGIIIYLVDNNDYYICKFKSENFNDYELKIPKSFKEIKKYIGRKVSILGIASYVENKNIIYSLDITSIRVLM